MPFVTRIQHYLNHPRFPLRIAVVAMLLCTPALTIGLIGDDYFQRTHVVGSSRFPDLIGNPLDLFGFLDGTVERNQALMDTGILPWWAPIDIRAAMFRPLTAITHWLDYMLIPNFPALMHLQNLLWYGAVILVVGFLYRDLFASGFTASLALLLFALDDAHGLPVGWLANRNTLLATFFGALTLRYHHRWCSGHRSALGIAAVCLLLGLLSAEAAIATTAYLFSYACFLDSRSSWADRLGSLLPYAVIVVGWRIVYSLLGYGVSPGAILYTDPVRDPVQFFWGFIQRAPILLLGHFFGFPGEFTILMPPAWVAAIWIMAILLVGTLVVLLKNALRHDPVSRFWCLGLLLSTLPITATIPMDRLLFFVGVGGMGLLATLLAPNLQEQIGPPQPNRHSTPTRVFIWGLIGVHLVLAPTLLPLRAWSPKVLMGVLNICAEKAPTDAALLRQDLVFVNGGDLCPGYIPIIRDSRGEPGPAHVRSLAGNFSSLTIHRPDEKQLEIQPDGGFLQKTERWSNHRYASGTKVELPGMVAEVLTITPDGRPLKARFTFNIPLEDPSFRWVYWRAGEVVPFELPAIGTTVSIKPAVELPF